MVAEFVYSTRSGRDQVPRLRAHLFSAFIDALADDTDVHPASEDTPGANSNVDDQFIVEYGDPVDRRLALWCALPLLVACGSRADEDRAAANREFASQRRQQIREDPSIVESAEPKPTQVALTVSQQQAVLAAKNYLNSGMGFSEQGLVDQLSSEHGNGFPREDAEFAVKHLEPNWDEQAEKAAESYMKSGMGFSRSSLIDQLSSEHGNQFTTTQAEHGADSVGL